MKNRQHLALIVAMAVIPAAHGAHLDAVVTKWKTYSHSVGASSCVGDVCQAFSAQAYEDMDGIEQGYISANASNFSTGQSASIYCYGPSYANIVSVSPGNGNATISITLDPSAASCTSTSTRRWS